MSIMSFKFPLTYLMYKFRKFKLVCLILITSVKVQDTFVYNSKKTRGKFKKINNLLPF